MRTCRDTLVLLVEYRSLTTWTLMLLLFDAPPLSVTLKVRHCLSPVGKLQFKFLSLLLTIRVYPSHHGV